MNISDNERALWVLKSKGPQPLAVLASEMGITTEGARFQLLRLQGEGLVEARSEAKGRGRPQQIWSLTAAGHARFPDSHADLTVRLIQKTRELFGEDGLQALIDASAQDARLKYRSALAGHTALEDRVRALSVLRDQEGYMARVEADGGAFLLIEDHCPICAAATACQNFCQAELSVFRDVIGPDAEVSRMDHLLSGARRCAYRVSSKS